MTAQEFVTWLRGFVAGSNNYNLTPKGWDEVKDKLSSVKDSSGPASFSFGPTSTSTATTLPPDTVINYTTDSKTLLHD